MTGNSLSRTMEGNILDWLTGTAFPAVPAGLYLALFTATPTETGGGTEVAGGINYARQAVTFGAKSNPDATSTRKSNNAAVTFGIPSGAWGTITHFALFDAVSGGNMLLYAPITASVVVGNGMNPPLTFAVGSIVLKMD
jgi:hypothetical protein